MSNRRNSNLLLQDIIDSGDRILRYTENMTFDEFVSNELVIDGVIRNFEIIGEAANRLTEDFKDNYSSIDWHKIRGFRNRIVHDYAGVDLGIVWMILKEFLPKMIIEIENIKL